MNRILLIGCGHMGSALLSSWINSNMYSVTIIDNLKHRSLNKKYKNNKIKILNSIYKLGMNVNYDLIVIAVKPSDLSKVLENLSKLTINDNSAIISVVAGKKISLFKKNLKNIKNFFRVMPNLPALIGESMNCIVSNKTADKKITKQVVKLFSHSGKTLFLENEDQIDKATAISGSGPGFIFNLIDAMEKSAIQLGFKENIAKSMVLQTFKGSIDLMIKSSLSAQELVKTVATKGGTTEAGLKIMKKNKVHKIFNDLTKSSYKKAKSQGK